MRLLLLALNARYSHTNPALRYLRNACEPQHKVMLMEWSINRRPDLIVEEILRHPCDMVGISCYIWNIHLVRQVITLLKAKAPQQLIYLGGPEAASQPLENLQAGADYLLLGEGETSLPLLLAVLEEQRSLTEVPGLCWLQQGVLQQNPAGPAVDLATLPLLYRPQDMTELKNRILYYESSRGCPFGCHFCLSAKEKLRLRPLEQVQQDLDFLFSYPPRQIKFIDRTFNVQPQRTHAILTYLRDHYQPGFHFHLEIEPALLNDDTVALLGALPLDYVQVEVGVQTTNPQVLRNVGRHDPGQQAFDYLAQLIQGDHIHIHLDIIAGLPEEDYASIQQTFNDLHALYPHYLQLGFLKVLPHTPLAQKAADWGIVYQPEAPYRVCYTRDLSREALAELKQVDGVLNKLYNNGYFVETLRQAAACWQGSAYDFYLALAKVGLGHIKKAPRLYETFYAFLQQSSPNQNWQSSLRLDWYRRFGHQPLPPVLQWGEDSPSLFRRYQQEILQLRPDLATLPRHKWHNKLLCAQFPNQTLLFAFDQPVSIRQPWRIYPLCFTESPY